MGADGQSHVLRAESGRGTGQRASLTQLVWDALALAGLEPAGLDRVVCDIGPGSFTGLRQGLAVARALAWVHQIPAVGVGSLESMHASVVAEAAGCLTGPVAVSLPARTGVDFVGWTTADGRWHEAVVAAADADAWWAAAGIHVLGIPAADAGRPWAQHAVRAGATLTTAVPDAAVMATLAQTRTAAEAEAALSPRYLAVSEAEVHAGIALPDVATPSLAGAH